MPCNSDHLEPNTFEAESKLAAELLVYIHVQLIGLRKQDEHDALPGWVTRASNQTYGKPDRIDRLTRMLCDECKVIENDPTLSSILYNGRSREARRLADWWDAHKRADLEKEERAQREVRRKKLTKTALEKLTDDEKEALGLCLAKGK